METKGTILTKEERDVLVLAATHPNGQHLNNIEIGQRLGISVNRVKTLIHQAFIKLGAHNRAEAILFAIKRGEIRFEELYTLEELAEYFWVLCPDLFKYLTQHVREELEHGLLPVKIEQITLTEKRQGTKLTKCEQDVLALVGRGLTNKEIADRLCLSNGTVRAFLNRACTKLGASNRAEAVVFALKQREISVGEIASLNEIVQNFAPSGAESVEKMAQLLDQKLGREPIPTGS